jgi:hypothetical protein
MAVDVIIDPSSGQIYWNDAAGSGTQTIAISGNATNAINVVGYSNFFNAGGGGVGTQILATFTDSPLSTFTPGTNAYDLGSTSLRWNFYGTAGNFNGAISTSSTTASTSSTTGALIVSGGVGIGGSLFTSSTSKSSISGVNFNNSKAENGFTINTTSSYTFNIQDALNNQRLNYHGDSNRTEFTGNNATHEIRLIHSNNSGYTGLKSNSSGTVTYTFPPGDGTSGQLLYTNGSGGLGWTTVAGGGVSGIISLNALTAATQTFAVGTSGSDFNISSTTSTHTFNIPYAGAASTGLVTTQAQTIAGAKTFSGQTSVTNSTASTSTTTGALIITGGVGIAGSIWSGQHVVTDTTVSSTTSTGAMLVFGGLGVSGQVNAASLQTSGNALISGNLTFYGVGVFGNATSDTINSLARYISDILPSTDNSYDLGNNSLGWRNFRISGVGTIATLQVTSVTSGLWAGSAVTLAYGGTNNNISGVGHSYRVAIYNDAGTAITNISSAGTANSILFQSSQSASPIWAGQSQLVVGGASTAAQWQTSRTVSFATGDVTGSFSINGSADVSNVALTIAANSVALGTDTTGNYAQSVAVSGSGITLGGTAGEGTDFTVYSSGTSANTVSTLVLRDGSGNFSAGTITASLTGTASIATSSINSATTTDTSSTLYLLGSRSSTGFAGTAIYVDSSISILGSQVTAGVWGGTAISAVNGGTGQNTYAIGDILYASSSTALTRLAAGTAGSVLASGGAGAAPSWVLASAGGGGGAGTVASGTSARVAFYPGTGSSVRDATGFEYITSGTTNTVKLFGGSAIGNTYFIVNGIGTTQIRVGIGVTNPQYELEIEGEISATNKSFVIDHPTKPGKKLRYGSLEGPENGVYVRGELKDSNIIETPDHWTGLVYPDSFTVTLTPIGRFSHLYVEKIEDYKIFIADAYMNPIHCYYTVWAERKDIPKLITEY